MCLVLRLLQLQPAKEIILEYILQEDFKYLRALGAYYWRLVAGSVEVYQELEPLLLDYRKLRVRLHDGKFSLTTMDQFIDDLLREDRVLEVILPRLTKRTVLEDNGDLEARTSPMLTSSLQGSFGIAAGDALEGNGNLEDHSEEHNKGEGTSDFRESLTLEETNALRLKLGLRPIVE